MSLLPLQTIGSVIALAWKAVRCAAAARLSPPLPLARRLAAIPLEGAPVTAPLPIHWNDQQIPVIEAANEDDLAVGLGVVHAHLRLTQMEVMRRAVHGRIAEMLGPAALEIDRGLRILDLPRACPTIIAAMPPETRRWIDRFVAGINHVITRSVELPPDCAMLGIGRTEWQLADVVALGRLAAADMNWSLLFNALRIYGGAGWERAWRDLRGEVELPDREDLVDLATAFTRTGSNALAVAGGKSSSGAALLAGDPHLDLVLPNLWLAGALHAPTCRVVGLMIPGLPFIAMGRNQEIGWAGTSLHAASTDLYDLSRLPAEEFRRREATVGARWAGQRTVSLRESPLGPVVSDVKPLSAAAVPVAMRWMGHRPSDEITAMLRLNRAGNWEEFIAAAAGISVPGQILLYGDRLGGIGRCLAVHLPKRPADPPPDLIAPPDHGDYWREFVDARHLPQTRDPPEGYLASANMPVEDGSVAVAYFHAPPARERRMNDFLAASGKVTCDALIGLQKDVYSAPAVELRDRLLALLARGGAPLPAAARHLRSWDGDYAEDSPGAAFFDLLQARLIVLLEGRRAARRLPATWDPPGVLLRRLSRMPEEAAAATVRQALRQAERRFRPPVAWGELHRLRLHHFAGLLPLLGPLFRYTDRPWPGSNDTLMKSAHGFSPWRHAVRYGSNARFIADMADPDRTYLLLLGGQDGWLGSTTFTDQVARWPNNALIQLPLRLATVQRLFPHKVVLRP